MLFDPPRSEAAPVPGNSGIWWLETNKRAGLVPEDVLRAVAVVDVEIDHRDARQAPPFQRMQCADGDVAEEAEAHGAGRVRHGGRAGAWRRRRWWRGHRARRRPPRSCRLRPGSRRPRCRGWRWCRGRRRRGLSRASRHGWRPHGPADGQQKVGDLRLWRDLSFEAREGWLRQRVKHRLQPRDLFGVAGRHFVVQPGGVFDQERRHRGVRSIRASM
jgi:hypothetical protein